MPWLEDDKIDDFLNEMYEGTKNSSVIGFGTATKVIAIWLYIIAKLLNIIIEKMDKK